MSDPAVINWKAIFLEAFFVVLGVVLALLANDWRESNSNKKRANNALLSILEEVTRNHEEVSVSIEYHSYLMDTLYKFTYAYGRDQDTKPQGRLFTQGFVKPAQTSSRAWDTAVSTGVVEHIEYQDVLNVSQVYEQQKQYENQSMMVAAEIYTMLFNQGLDGITSNYQNLNAILGTFMYRECDLAKSYNHLHDRMGHQYNTAPTDSLGVPGVCMQMPG